MKIRIDLILRLCLIFILSGKIQAQPPTFPGEKTTWHGFDRYDFVMDEQSLSIKPFKPDPTEKNGVKPPAQGQRRCIVVVPTKAAPGNPWSWQGCYWDHEPQTEIELLKRGFVISFITPDPGKEWDAWYTFLTEKYGLSKKPAFVGMSKGGVNEYDWATTHPDKVSCIYADNPAIRPETFAKLDLLAQNDVPLLNICGSADFLLERTTLPIEKRYHELGGKITVMIKEGPAHHPHSLKNPKLIADWIESNMKLTQEKRPSFANDQFTKTYYYGLENTYHYLEEEKTYATSRGPGFTPFYERYDLKTSSQWGVTGMAVIVPSKIADGKPWIFRVGSPERSDSVDLAMLARGYHIVVAPLTAQSGAVRAEWDSTYRFLVRNGFSGKPVLEGKGAAAGETYAWAIENPDKVSAIYSENPLMTSLMIKNPVLDFLGVLANSKIPILSVSGSKDPWLAANTKIAAQRYKKLGGRYTVIIREGEGHFLKPHDPAKIVDFIRHNTK